METQAATAKSARVIPSGPFAPSLAKRGRVARPGINALVSPTGLFPGLRRVVLAAGQVLHRPGKPIRHVYFPTGCLVSLFTEIRLQDDNPLEVALIGSEGMVGAFVALGDKTAWTRALVQAPGTAFRATAESFLQALERTESLRHRALRYTSDLSFLFAQSAACSRNHSTQQRLARWLLMAYQRLGSEDGHFTQQLIADALSVRRTGVSEAAATLRRLGVIRYRHGFVEIVDEARLRIASCPCLGIRSRKAH